MQQLTPISQGIDADYQSTLMYLDSSNQEVPVTTYTDADELIGEVWAGGGQPVLFMPTCNWLDAPNGVFKITIAGASTASLAPGTYRLRVRIATTDGRKILGLDVFLPIVTSPGAEAEASVYCTYQDLLDHAQFLENEFTDKDTAGFARQRASARAFINRTLLTWYAALNRRQRTSEGWWYGAPTIAKFKSYLDGNGVEVSARLLEIAARYSVSLILENAITPSKENPYRELASEYRTRAEILMDGLRVHVKNVDDGVDFWLDDSQVSSKESSCY